MCSRPTTQLIIHYIHFMKIRAQFMIFCEWYKEVMANCF